MKKKIILFIILMLVFLVKANASTTTYNRSEKENNGVNKKWNITDKNINNVLNTPLINADEKIYDFSDILTDEEEETLYSEIDKFIEKYNTDVVILTYDLPYYNDSQNEDFAADFYDYNDFGITYDNYSGILLFRNTYSNDPYFDVYSFGNAQLYISPNRADKLLDDIYNDLHNQNYLSGFKLFIGEINAFYENGIPSEMKNYYVDEYSYLRKKYKIPIAQAIPISFFITIIIIFVLLKRNKMVAKKVSTQVYLSNIMWNKKEDNFINKHVSSYTIPDSNSSGGGSGGFSSHSGSSGGGHSSGGGRHG